MCIAFGGHKNAVGLSVSKENIAKLKEMIESEVLEEAQEIVEYDMVMNFKQISLEIIEILLKLEPFGEKNPYPAFMFKNVKVSDKKEYDKVDRYILSQEVEKDSARKEISLVGICFSKRTSSCLVTTAPLNPIMCVTSISLPSAMYLISSTERPVATEKSP